MKGRTYARSVLLVVVAFAALLAPGTAGAVGPRDPAPELISTHQSPMYITRYDHAVAKAHGFVVKRGVDGREYAEPVTPAAKRWSDVEGRAAGVRPQGQVYGDCGFSFVHLYDAGVKRYRVWTGFGVYTSAVGYYWRVNVVGPAYNETPSWKGSLAFSRTWEANHYDNVPNRGTYSAKASGYALLWNGGVCNSRGPIDNEAIL